MRKLIRTGNTAVKALHAASKLPSTHKISAQYRSVQIISRVYHCLTALPAITCDVP